MADELTRPFGHVIDGKLLVEADQSAAFLEVINPATEEVLVRLPAATRQTLDTAVAAARKAFTTWRHVPFEERAERVAAWGKTYEAQMSSLIRLLSLEQGKSHGVAGFEFAENVRWFTELAELVPRETVILDNEKRKVIKRYTPVGVCAGLVPWNFPIILGLWKAIPALLMGNCIIIKPSPFTPLCTIRIIEAAQKHFPPGVLQCVVGNDQLGPWITEHPDIDKIAFTGSTATGRLVARSCAATLKRVTLELGGNDACIVLADVDLEQTVGQVLFAATVNSAQFCAASKRIYIHEAIYDAFAKEMARQASAAKIGPASHPDTVHGPINNKQQFERVNDLVRDSVEQGHSFAFGGGSGSTTSSPQKGYFAPITLIDNPPDSARVVQEEAFGPVVPLMKWSDEQDLLRRVNDSPYGLGAIVMGRDRQAVDRIARSIESGTVWINSPQCFDAQVPFGGVKASGYGYEAGGVESLTSYANVQVLSYAK